MLDIGRIVAESAFQTLYQPVVDLTAGEIVGFEALTRFTCGVRPDLVYAQAWAVGLGEALERATFAAALREAARLPAGTWLSVNLSFRLLLAEPPLVVDLDRPLVLELTEHEAVEDYDVVAAAITRLPAGVEIAVDDAGAGYASLGHVLRLRPAYLKLDASLVQGVATDTYRQALVACLATFAARVGCTLVAEGLENDAEIDAVVGCGVELGQGHRLGMPAPGLLDTVA